MRPYEIPWPDGQATSRREQLLAEAARLFAARGFRGVGIDDIGAAAGISGPGIYRHFSSKEEILAVLLVGISQYLHDGGQSLAERFEGDSLLSQLIAFHVDFSLTYRDLIVLHDRELDSLESVSREEVRRLQRIYVAIWVKALLEARPDMEEKQARLRAHACFGLLNSTPHLNTSALGSGAGEVLAAMGSAALYA